VGIDGDNSNTVEQTGTDSDCSRGTPTYYAWYEMYPKKVIKIPITLNPGDSITGTVSYSSGIFTLTLTDTTTHATYTTTQTSSKAVRTSVEWIVEGPSSGTLSNFGTEPFTSDTATINGQSGSLDSFSAATPITMVSAQGTTRAAPSGLGPGGSFTDTWQHG
jgi:Peptidase A4 family